ncbi:uncharacterized protein A1O9_05781 [Exophiala aquamarina CBS 119918]|uniref:Uncharacterized protein n=1 Tax=Exophiala aquamarina CBS 119918 TaxID=1182545 RepID=A0A072PQT4_9EURO|nr:uncharacterized protein A1O9_05781 [Exophiala aquamarina CBS 119918]KEF57860.1 hypothetical protein A1O9_05781 [Exophiala aquamarina CBS 119918]
MADSGSRNGPSIPEWQKTYTSAREQTASTNDPSAPDTSPDLPSLEQAKRLPEDASNRDASKGREVAPSERKDVPLEYIGKALDTEPESQPAEMNTIHDSSQTTSTREQELQSTPSLPSAPVPSQPAVSSKRDIPPIITYPEFLLKPQKPPPLVTLDRLRNAAYVLAGISALTYGASKYLVEPMLQTLTEARHELAEGTQEDLEKLNSKLESVVSHVPYIASSAALQRQKEQGNDDDLESIDSDPTELFHRDIATQTSPKRSRSNSSSNFSPDKSASDPTAQQTTRLKNLHADLSSLLSSTNTHFSQDRLKERVTEFQGVLNKMDSSFNPFTVDYTLNYPDDSLKNKQSNTKDNEIAKFKAEIRSLKGAFLSSRNFPTARAPTPFALPTK